jgi:hypothetical protein
VSAKPPLYARVLRLRHIRPGGLLCFVFFEGTVALGILLALAELAPWWSAIVLPAVVAIMVKVNDLVAGWNARARPVPAHVRTATTKRPAVPKARGADPPTPVRASGRASAPGALAPSELPGFGSGAGSLGDAAPATGAIYRHAPEGIDTRHQSQENETTGEHRRTLNQGRFE